VAAIVGSGIAYLVPTVGSPLVPPSPSAAARPQPASPLERTAATPAPPDSASPSSALSSPPPATSVAYTPAVVPAAAQAAAAADSQPAPVEPASNQAALRHELEAWTSHHTNRDAMNTLQQAGVRAGAVLTGADMLQDPHLRARGYYQVVEHPRAGKQTLRVAPYHLSETPPTIRKAAPCLGEDTESVLREVLGVSDGELAELAEAHVTDNVPLQHQAI